MTWVLGHRFNRARFDVKKETAIECSLLLLFLFYCKPQEEYSFCFAIFKGTVQPDEIDLREVPLDWSMIGC